MSENKNVAEILSEGALKVKFEDLSEHNIDMAKRKLIDNIGNIAGGALAFGNREVLNVVSQYEEVKEAPVFMLGKKASLGNAAMINAMASRSNDYEPMFMNIDGNRMASKESATLINAVLTAGAVYGFSGKDYLAHEVVGEDLSCRIIAAGGRWKFDVGYDSSFTMPIYGVCAQFARMRGLDALQLRDAWGMAMGMVGGTMSHIFDYATSAKLGAGYNIRNADFCTRLAKEGFSSLNNIFEGPRNIYRQYRGMDEACNKPLLTADYGKKFYMEETIKMYPVGSPAIVVAHTGSLLYGCCRTEDITDILFEMPDNYTEMYYIPPYETGRDPLTHAQFSYQYALCAPLMFGPFSVRHYSEGALRNPELIRLCGLTRMVHASDLAERTIRVTITEKDGSKHVKQVGPNEFNRENASYEDILAKYWDQINGYNLISHAAAQKCIDLVEHLEDVKDIREITSLIEG